MIREANSVDQVRCLNRRNVMQIVRDDEVSKEVERKT